MRYIIQLLFIGLIIMQTSSSVRAYTPNGEKILELMLVTMGTATTLTVDQEVIIFSAKQETVAFRENLWFQFPDQFRSEMTSATTTRIQVVRSAQISTTVDEKPGSETRFDFYKDLLLYRSISLLSDRLKKAGVDLKTTSLGRLQSRPIWVLGAVYPDQTQPQIWFSKTDCRPLRWIIDDSLEIFYAHWSDQYPRKIKFLENKVLVREITVGQIKIDPLLNPAIFEPLKFKSQDSPGNEFDEQMQAVEKSLEDFQHRYNFILKE